MKTKKIIMALALVAMSSFAEIEKAQAHVSVSFQLFYDELSPYGHWVSYPQYGYVWIPAGVAGFSPYGSGGHWVFTEFGWTWVSDYAWGWAPFHYGRWHFDPFYGWLWVPGTEWGPAWVCWRHSPGFYGWAPIPPGVSLAVAFGPRYVIPHERWFFVNEKYVSSPRLSAYYASRNNNGAIIQKSTVINNTYIDKSNHTTFVSGPNRDDVQKITGSEIRPVAIKDNSKPGSSLNKNELNIYRPDVKKDDATKPVPRKVENIKDIKPASTGNAPQKEQPRSSVPKNDVKDQQPSKSVSPQRNDAKETQPDKNAPQQSVRPADDKSQPQKNVDRGRDMDKSVPWEHRIERRTSRPQPVTPGHEMRQPQQQRSNERKRDK